MGEQVIQRVFTGGEISPELRSRADLEKYVAGLSLCKNFIIRSQGGVFSRGGTKYIDEIKDSSVRGRLVPFSFNTTQNYILLFENNVIRVIKDGGYVLDGGLPFELVTTYTTAQLSRLIFTQDADVMTIAHPDHDPARLSRIADDNWSLDDVDYASTVALPTSLALAGVGTASGLPDKTFRYVVTTVDADGVESLPTAEQTITQNALGTTYGVRLTWVAAAGADYYRVYRDPSNGTGIYAWVGDTENLLFEDYNVSPDNSDAPPTNFLPFAGAEDKPATVGYFQQRQVFANTNNAPQDIFQTRIGNYESMQFSRPGRVDDAVFFTLKARQVNEIRHIVGMDSLIFLTSGGEWKMSEGRDRVLSTFTMGLRRQSKWGSSWTRPAEVGDSIVFVQEKGNHIRDLTYEFEDDKYRGNNLSVMSYHLFRGFTIDEMDYAEESDNILWCIRSDGVLLGMTYTREQNVWAWHQHNTPALGLFESVAVISEDGRDAPYFIIKRTIDGNIVRYVERMEPLYDANTQIIDDVWYVDSALQYNGVAATVMTGLEHLEGEVVHGVADGNEVGPLTVNSGQVTIPNASEKVTLGLLYIPSFETLDIEPQSLQVTLKGKRISVSLVTLEVSNTRGGWVGSKNDDGSIEQMYEIKPRYDSDDYDPLALKSFKQEVAISSGWGRGGAVKIEQRSPFPLNILSVISNVDVS